MYKYVTKTFPEFTPGIYIYIERERERERYGLKNTHNILKITNISLLFRSFVNVKTNFKQKYR